MPKADSKKTIAVDIDDTLAAEAGAIIEFSNQTWGHSFSLDDYSENWVQMWEVEFEEAERRANVLHSPGMVSKYKALEKAHEVLKQLSKDYRLIIITSRRKRIEAETLGWIEANFGGVFSEIHLTGFWDNPHPEAHLLTKAEISKSLGADYLIDDQLRHCIGAAEAGVKAILFGNYAESRAIKLPKNVTRCQNWQEVLEYFNAES